MKNKKIILIILCITALFMAIGYAAFATNLRINGSVGISGKWLVHFTSIKTETVTGGASNNTAPTASGTVATMDANLDLPGDSITYTLTLANDGNVNAIIDNIDAKAEGSNAIIYSMTGIKKGDKLATGASKTITIKIEYDKNFTSQPEETTKLLTVNINCVQDVGQTITGEDVVVEGPVLLSSQILRDNTAQPDTNISSDTTSASLYYTNTNTEDNKKTYYFRGNVTNNYVSFAGFTWRIIRINEDGSTRLIKLESIGDSVFNSNYNDNAYVGYMYGTAGASTYAETHKNTNSSTIKTVLDTWYQNNLTSYSSLIADAGFCGDRSLVSGTGIGMTIAQYSPNNRVLKVQPQFACPQENDLYTTKTSTKGNKALTYPIGLITADEVMYAGGYNGQNKDYYLANNGHFWTMSPDVNHYSASEGSESRVKLRYVYNYSTGDARGILSSEYSYTSYGVRPVINLKSNVNITSGNGTSTNPYVIKTN